QRQPRSTEQPIAFDGVARRHAVASEIDPEATRLDLTIAIAGAVETLPGSGTIGGFGRATRDHQRGGGERRDHSRA
ncbi:hypothetical protein ACAG11_27015, partial [Escherichia coli]